jgi:hypothetical protein
LHLGIYRIIHSQWLELLNQEREEYGEKCHIGSSNFPVQE